MLTIFSVAFVIFKKRRKSKIFDFHTVLYSLACDHYFPALFLYTRTQVSKWCLSSVYPFLLLFQERVCLYINHTYGVNCCQCFKASLLVVKALFRTMSSKLAPCVALSNGQLMPLLGLGTYKVEQYPRTTNMNLGQAHCLALRAPTLDLWPEITKS
jgi:hypothetical protein